MPQSGNRHDRGDPPSTMVGAHSPSRHHQQAVVALVIGGCTIAATCLVGYLAYQVNREMLFRHVAKENLAIARTVANYMEVQPLADGNVTEAESLKQIRAFWRQFDPPTPGTFLCVVTPEGKMVVCTAHTNMEGGLVNDLPLGKPSDAGATTIGDLLSTRQDFFGEDVTLMGEQQIVGFTYSKSLNHGVMVHIPAALIESEVAAASWPWSVGIGLVAGLLIPLSLGLLYRSFSSAQRAAILSANALQASEAEYSDLYENSPDMYVSVNAQTARIERCNQTLATALGYAKEEIVGRRVFGLYHLDSMGAASQAFAAFVKTGEVHDAEVQLKRKDGSPLDASLNVSAIRDENGKVLYSRSCWRDNTQRKRMEKAKQLVDAQMRQQQKIKSIGTLAGGVAHEINNPLNGIINFAQLIDERLDPESPLHEFAGGITQETERVADIVRNLLSFARLEKESHSVANIEDIANNAIVLISTIIRRDQITLEVDVPDNLPKIRCRSQLIQQVLMNLLTNARDALNARYPEYDEDKIMSLAVRPFEKEGQPWLRVTVEDHGSGIPNELRDRLFDPFFTTKDRDKGKGMGLSISHGIVEDHHGELYFESKPGECTRFHVELPVDNEWTMVENSGKQLTGKDTE